MSKYKNKKITYNGMTFDSKKEYRRYCELEVMQRHGDISDLQTQVKFELIPSQREPDTIGKRGGIIKGRVIERSVNYVADFVYKDRNGKTIVEDTKGMRTHDYIIKRKLLLWVHGIQIKEI